MLYKTADPGAIRHAIETFGSLRPRRIAGRCSAAAQLPPRGKTTKSDVDKKTNRFGDYMNQLEKTRRRVMKYCALGLVTGALLKRADKVAAMQTSTSPTSAATITGRLKAEYKKNSEKLLLPPACGGVDQPPQPAAFDMLPMSWNQRQMRLLFSNVAQRGVRGCAAA